MARPPDAGLRMESRLGVVEILGVMWISLDPAWIKHAIAKNGTVNEVERIRARHGVVNRQI